MTNTTENKFKLKDPGSAITHFIGMLMAVFAAVPLIIKAVYSGSAEAVTCSVIFIVSMILLYLASTMYHSIDRGEKVNMVLKKLDHAMIFVLIAGSYTPVCLLVVGGTRGIILLGIVWAVGILGIIFKLCWVTCPKWISSVMYIAMGWLCVLAFTPIINNLSSAAFHWLFVGGVIYTVGGVLYAVKTPAVKAYNERHRYFGTHEIFHVFVMLGSICHFVLVYQYLA